MAKSPDKKVVKELNKKDPDLKTDDKYDFFGHLGQELLVSSQIYKQPRMNTIIGFERLYNNSTLPKFRQLFNVVPPVFSGMVDEMQAMFNDEIRLEFKARNPSQLLVTPKIQAHWEAERDSMESNAMWDYKTRQDRFNALLSGRGILQEYAYNEPEYTNVLNIVNYSDFHCQPLGGGVLENHTFCGTEGNYKTLYDLKANPKYSQKQVEKLENYAWSNRMFTELETSYGTKFARWKALGLNVLTNNFSGELTYNLCDFVITYNGQRYNVVFEPCSQICIYVEEWEGKYPYKSWATHPDDKNFWSKGYADDFYPVAQSIITLFNQELTNREKQNFNARAFDKDMFKDVAKLDAAQQRPDALVPADTMGGTKQISQGIYAFATPELKGTVDLIQWTSDYLGQKTGADELPQKGSQKNVGIMLAMQQKQSKRVGLRSSSFEECYKQLGETYIEGLREYMPPKLSVQIIGENGFTEETELKRIEVKRAGAISIMVRSSTEQEQQDTMKKQAKAEAITQVTGNPTLTPYEKEVIYREIGGFDESEIQFLLDKKGDLSRKQYAHASQNIQDILLEKEPDIYYGADISYLSFVKQYLVDNKNKIMGKEKGIAELLTIMGPIVQQNMTEQAKVDAQNQQQQNQQNGQQDQNAQKTNQPSNLGISAKAASMGQVMK